MRALERSLRERGVSTDAREPDIVRALASPPPARAPPLRAPAPAAAPTLTALATLALLTLLNSALHQVRISPAPLFNSFDDVRRFIAALTECLGELA